MQLLSHYIVEKPIFNTKERRKKFQVTSDDSKSWTYRPP